MVTSKYVLNAVAIRTGGGLQKTLSLIEVISQVDAFRNETTVIAAAGSPLHALAVAKGVNCLTVGRGYAGRLAFEASAAFRVSRKSVVLNAGGLPIIGLSGRNINVGECAYSNLFFPEIPFWSSLSGGAARRARLRDAIRRTLLLRLDYWIFQTELVKSRAIELFDFPAERCAVVPPAPSAFATSAAVSEPAVRRYKDLAGDRTAFLALAGPQANKRLHLIPGIAARMLAGGFTNFCFVLSLDESSAFWRAIADASAAAGVRDHVVTVGTVPQQNVGSLLTAADAVCLFSRLESFSNNFVEAWVMRRPLVVTDADWSRDAAGDAAMYVNPEDADGTASALRTLALDGRLRERLIDAGERRLSTYSTPEARAHLYFEILNEAKRLGSCPAALKPVFR